MIRIHQRLFRRPLEEIFRMMSQELVNRIGRGYHHSCCGFETTSSATCLLPRGSNGARVADEDRRAQPANVDSKFQRVCGDHGFDSAIPESFFDFSS